MSDSHLLKEDDPKYDFRVVNKDYSYSLTATPIEPAHSDYIRESMQKLSAVIMQEEERLMISGLDSYLLLRLQDIVKDEINKRGLS